MGVIESRTPAEFDLQWEALRQQYSSLKAIRYLSETWIPHKHCFVASWTNGMLHFGNRTSSRCEGQHSKVKRHLHTSTHDLHEVLDRLHNAFETSAHELETQIAGERINVHREHKDPFFKDVVGQVSVFSLKKVEQQLNLMRKLNNNSEECSNSFSKTMSLPCQHQIREMIANGQILRLWCFHPIWHLVNEEYLTASRYQVVMNVEAESSGLEEIYQTITKTYDLVPAHQKQHILKQLLHLAGTPPRLENPCVESTRGRPSASSKGKRLNESSTRRDPSAFELVEASTRCAQRCGICKETGHNRRACPQRVVFQGEENE